MLTLRQRKREESERTKEGGTVEGDVKRKEEAREIHLFILVDCYTLHKRSHLATRDEEKIDDSR